jgi:hypothetical protein
LQKLFRRNIILPKITGNILDENEKLAKMLKCGVDKAPGVVAEMVERVKDETLVWDPHYLSSGSKINWHLHSQARCPALVGPPTKAFCPFAYSCIVDVNIK